MAKRRIECFTVDVDGEPVLVRGVPGSMDEHELELFRDLIRAAKRKHAREHPEQADDG